MSDQARPGGHCGGELHARLFDSPARHQPTKTQLIMKNLKYLEVTPESLGVYFDYLPKEVSKGQRDGHQRVKTQYILTELWEGAWECYYPNLQGVDYLFTTVHMLYLETRERVMRYGDPADLKNFKRKVMGLSRTYKERVAPLRKYLDLNMETICGARIKMDKLN